MDSADLDSFQPGAGLPLLCAVKSPAFVSARPGTLDLRHAAALQATCGHNDRVPRWVAHALSLRQISSVVALVFMV
jgi:hypothetical protein